MVMRWSLYLVALVISSTLIHAASNTTQTPETRGWANEPSGRGSLNLLWSCFLTLSVCTWTMQHPGVGMTDAGIKSVNMVYAFFGPEFYATQAIKEWYDARKLVKDLAALGYDKWTMTHSFFAIGEGFSVRIGSDLHATDLTGTGKLLWMVQHGHMPLPDITRDELLDRSKVDSLAKAITVLQSGWLVIQCIARRAQNLPVSTLELTTVAFVACTVITYAAWWSKPKDIKFPIETKIEELSAEARGGLKLADRRVIDDSTYGTIFCVSNAIIGTIFGGLHCLAWNFHFPTAIERSLWRAASIISAAALPTSAILLNSQSDKGRLWQELLISSGLGITALLYIGARIFIFVEVFLSLRAAPSGIYETVQWVQYLPKLS